MSKKLPFYLLASLIFLAGQCFADDTLIDDAYTAYKNRDDKALAGYVSQMQGQPLAAYPEYWRLLLTLDQTDSATIDAFLARYSDTPFAEKLRQEWLKSLGKQQNWTQYMAELPKLTLMDTANSCYAALAQAGDKAALQNAKPLWLNANDLPTNCDDLFDVMQGKGVIKDSDVWARLRLIFQANHISVAKSAASYLSKPPNTAALKLFDRVYEDPQRMLEKKNITTKTRLGRELNFYALERVARSQPDLAVELWERCMPISVKRIRSMFGAVWQYRLHAITIRKLWPGIRTQTPNCWIMNNWPGRRVQLYVPQTGIRLLLPLQICLRYCRKMLPGVSGRRAH